MSLRGVATTATAPATTPSLGARVVGSFFLVMAGVHLGIVAVDATTYAPFADRSPLGFVRQGWTEIVMAHPAVWGLLLMAGEVVLGSLLLAGGQATRAGWAGVIVFHVLLLPFGWWVWAWCVPALAVLLPLARRDLRRSHAPLSGVAEPVTGAGR